MVPVPQDSRFFSRKYLKSWLDFGGGVCAEDNIELRGISGEKVEHTVSDVSDWLGSLLR